MNYRTVAISVGALLAVSALTMPVTASAQSSTFSNATPLEVDLSNYKFMPEPIQLKAGQAYRLTLVNQAHGGHNFTAREFFAAAQVAPEDAGKVSKGQVKLKGGESVTLTLVPAAGTYDLSCTILGHAGRGMKGHIVVE
jgi:uncharacterized cupredoxin-like copper-binding protein